MRRPPGGALNLQLEPVDVQDLIGATLEQMRNRINHLVNINLPDDLPLINADFVLVQQAVINLLDNAIKYSLDNAPIDIVVHLANGWMYLDVQDRGP